MAAPDPYVFISHKHSDAPIADVIATFVTMASAGQVKVHNSSSNDFEGPRLGKNLNEELKKALAQASIVLLVYTSEGEDWQYCMWECGIATDPWDEHPTDVIVLQCGKDIPRTYGDRLRVDVRDAKSVEDFTKEFLTTPDFFPGRNEPVAILPEKSVKNHAKDLFENLEAILPDLDKVATDFSAATYVGIELPAEAVAKVKAAEENHSEVVLEMLETSATIIDKDRAQSFFGFEIATGTGLGPVLEKWKSKAGPEDTGWIESLADQIGLAIHGEYPAGVPLAPIRTEGGRATIPYVTRSRTLASGAMQFDTQFIPLAPQPMAVAQKMLPIDQVFFKSLESTDPADVPLAELLAEMGEGDRSRVPVLGEGGRPKYIIHKSMIDQFASERAFQGENVTELTMEDLLEDEEMEAFFASTFAVVSPKATLAEAREAMERVSDCQDVFVTEDGTAESKVTGWLTNVTFLESEGGPALGG